MPLASMALVSFNAFSVLESVLSTRWLMQLVFASTAKRVRIIDKKQLICRELAKFFLSSFVQEKDKLSDSIESKILPSNVTAVRQAFSEIDKTAESMLAMCDSL